MSQNFAYDSQTVAQAIDRNDVQGAASLLSQIYQTDSRAFAALVGSEQTREQQNPGITHLAIQDQGNGTRNVLVTDDVKSAYAGTLTPTLDSYQAAQPLTGVVTPRLDSYQTAQPLTDVVTPRLDSYQMAQPLANWNGPLNYSQNNYRPGYTQAALYNPQQQLNFEAQRLSQFVNYNNFGGTVALLQNEFRTNPGVAVRLVQNEVMRERMQPALMMPGHTHVEMRNGAALVSDSYHQPVIVGRVGSMNPSVNGNYGAYAYAPMPVVMPMRPFIMNHRRV